MLSFFFTVEYTNLCQKIEQVKQNMTSKYCCALNFKICLFCTSCFAEEGSSSTPGNE